MLNTSICILLYGDYPELTNRVLHSVLNGPCGPCPYAQDVRIGLHDLSEASKKELTRHLDTVCTRGDWQCPIILYEPVGNIYKYPTMRRMFWDEEDPIGCAVMWFDDDTYITSPTFWKHVEDAVEEDDPAMMGQLWTLQMQGAQGAWIRDQHFYNPSVEWTGKMRFCQGAWWWAKTAVLHAINWPIPELKHCGGDSLLGEVLRHQGFRIKSFDTGLRINANDNGEHSKSKRRGYSSLPLGADYKGVRYDTSHQIFGLTKCVLQPTSKSSS